MKTAAVIPFYNERRFLGRLIPSVSRYVDVIIAVDDGSTDDSGEVLRGIDSVMLISHTPNQGKGFALRKGLEKAAEIGAGQVVCLDGDLQHPPEKIPEFLEALHTYDLVTGKRARIPGVMPLQRILSNSITSTLLSMKLGVTIDDSQCGFRSMRGEVIPHILPDAMGYEAETEMLIKAAKMGFSIGSVPIPTVYGDEESKMRAIPAITGFIKQLMS